MATKIIRVSLCLTRQDILKLMTLDMNRQSNPVGYALSNGAYARKSGEKIELSFNWEVEA